MAGHMSAPLGLEWFPPSLEKQLNRIDLGKMMIDPAFFPKRLGWTKSVGTYRMEMINENKRAKGCRSRRCVKGRLSWVMAGHMSAPLGLEWFPPSLEKQLNRIDLGKMMIDPALFFQTPWLDQKCWYLKTGGGCWKHVTAGCSSQLGLAFVSSKSNWHMWEVGGNAISCWSKAHDNSAEDVAGD